MDMGRGEERVRCMERLTWKLTIQITNRNLPYVSGNSDRTLYQPRGVGLGGRWEGGSEGRGYMCPWTDPCSGLTENNKIL